MCEKITKTLFEADIPHILVYLASVEKKTIFAVKCHFLAFGILKFTNSSINKFVTFRKTPLRPENVC